MKRASIAPLLLLFGDGEAPLRLLALRPGPRNIVGWVIRGALFSMEGAHTQRRRYRIRPTGFHLAHWQGKRST
jgi:hypothetical protein